MYSTVYINFIMFSLGQEKPNDTLLPLYFFSMPCTWIWKLKVSLIWATDFPPTLFCFGRRTFSKFLPDCCSHSCLEKKDNNKICHLKTINTIHQWEIWWEVDQYPGSCKLWQKPLLFLLQATYWKQQMSQLSMG